MECKERETAKMASRKRKKPLTATKKSPKTSVNRRLPSLQKKTKRPRKIPRDKRGRFISAKPKGKKNGIQRRKTPRTERPRPVSRRVPARKSPEVRGKSKSERGSNARKTKSRQHSGRVRVAASRKKTNRRKRSGKLLSTGIHFLDGQDISGRDPSFNRAVRVRDNILDITTNRSGSPRAMNNVLLGIDGKTLPIKKRSIAFKRPKKFSETTDENDWKQDAGIREKVNEVFDDLGPGIYYVKNRLGFPIDEDEIGARWISSKRRRITTQDEMDDYLYDVLRTLQISRNTNIYGLLDSGYSFDEIEIERLE